MDGALNESFLNNEEYLVDVCSSFVFVCVHAVQRMFSRQFY